MSDIGDIKHVLGKLVQTVELMADETAELVDKYHRQYTKPEFHYQFAERSAALVSAAQELRQVAEKVLDKTDLPARKELPL